MNSGKLKIISGNPIFENIEVFLRSKFKDLDAQILIGSMCFTKAQILSFKAKGRLILFNLEQIPKDYNFVDVNRPIDFLENFKLFDEIWDYDEINIKRLNRIHIFPKFLPFMHTNDLCRYDPLNNQDIDVLFYGSLNYHRKEILDKIKEVNPDKNIVISDGLMKDSLDVMLKRTKILLNIHYVDWADIQEQSRIFYPLINGTTVVSEYNENNNFKGLIYNIERDILPTTIKTILAQNDDERKVEAYVRSFKYKDLHNNFDMGPFK